MPPKTDGPDELTRTLFRLSREILAGSDLDAILEFVVAAITAHTPFGRAALALYDRPIAPASIADVQIARTAQSGLTPEEEARIEASPLPAEERIKIFQEEFRVSRSYYIPADRNPWAERSGFVAGRVRGTDGDWHPEDMCFILMWLSEDELVGLISVDDPRDGRAPTPATIEPLEAFANLAALAIAKARDIEAMRASRRRLRGVYRLSAELAGAEDLDTLVERAMAVIVEGFEYDYGALLLVDGDALVLRGTHTTLPMAEVVLRRGTTLSLEEGVTGWVARDQATAWVRDARADARFIAAHPALRSELAVPIVADGETLGVLNIESSAIDGFNELDRELLEALADQLAVAIESVRRRRELEERATHDPLTGAYNRHFFAELVEWERARSARNRRPISLVMLDLDDFHRVNERHGHRVGDRVLRAVADVLMGSVREMDAVIRYGGDEFLVVMPEADGAAAEQVCRRIESFLAEQAFAHGAPVRASLGTATWHPGGARSLDEVLDEADRWMYRRKGEGERRDR